MNQPEAIAAHLDETLLERRKVWAALAIGGAAFFLLCGYEFIRSASTSAYVEAYGAERLPLVMAMAPVGTLAYLYLYGWILSWLGARRALFLTSLLSGLGIAGLYLAMRAGSHVATAVLYVVREAYIVVLVEQYWSFIDSTLGTGSARRLNGPVCGIASLGAIGGGFLVGRLARGLGTEAMLLFAAASLVPAGIMAAMAFGAGGEPQPDTAAGDRQRSTLGLRQFARNRTLTLLLLLIVATQVVSTVLDLRFNGLLRTAYPVKDDRTAFSGNFYGILNAIAFVLQFVVTPLALRWLPLRAVHVAIPLVHVAAAAVLAVHPVLAAGAMAYLLFKTLDYSVFRAAKEILYIPLPFDARYRAKQVIDSFGYRAAKGGTSALLALAAKGCGGVLPGLVYPVLAAGAALTWLGLALGLTRPAPEGAGEPHPPANAT